MERFSYRDAAGKGSGRGTEGRGAVVPLSANAAAAVAAAIGHASLSRRGATSTSASDTSLSSAAARAAGRGSDAAAAPRAHAATAPPAAALPAASAGGGGGMEGRPAAVTFEGKAVLSKASVSNSTGNVPSRSSATATGLPTYAAPLSDATSAAAAAPPAVAAAGYLAAPSSVSAAAAAPVAHTGAVAGRGGGTASKGGKAEPVNTVDVLGRKVWDKSYYEARAQSKDEEDDYLSFLPAPRQKKVAPPVEHRRPLQRRDFSIDLTKELGRSKIVTLQTPRMQQGGFWCDVCECLIKDSAAYLDHVNGRNHNRMLGMTMRVERAPPERVIGKLRELERQAQLELEGEDPVDNTGGGSVTAGGGAAGEGGTGGASLSLHAKTEGVSAAAATGASAAAGKVRRPVLEENYDDIDRIKRRLEELQKQEEEKKLRRKLKKRRKKAGSATGEDDENPQGPREEGRVKEEEQEETEEQKMLKSMGLPSGFVGS